MKYQTVVAELFLRFPELKAANGEQFAYTEKEGPSPYLVFGSILVPALGAALEKGDLARILPICGFLEDVSIAAREDANLAALMKIEVSKWLGQADNEEYLAPWLGAETKRLCNYVPGLATQRRRIRAEKAQDTVYRWIGARIKRMMGS